MPRVMLIKAFEDAERVEYRYGLDPERLGLLELDKQRGDAYVRAPAPGEEGEQLFFAAALRAREHWRERSFPEESEIEL